MSDTQDRVYGNAIPRFAALRGRLLHRYYSRRFKKELKEQPLLGFTDDPYSFPFFKTRRITARTEAEPILSDTQGVILGTIRMGFGHVRMAIALASAARQAGLRPYWLDLSDFSASAAGKTIRALEGWYNLASRISQHSKWFNELIWERITSSGGRGLAVSYQNRCLSELFVPVFKDLPQDMPIFCTHPWVAHGAVSAGMKRVISLVPDNYPVAFYIVEGSIHAVQSPSAYTSYRTFYRMEQGAHIRQCMPRESIFEVGHFVDHEIVSNIEKDCEKRLKRLADKRARRFLLTMGGAGAQTAYFAAIIRYCKEALLDGRLVICANLGDHQNQWQALRRQLERDGIPWILHRDWNETLAFTAQAGRSDMAQGVHVFLSEDLFPAVYTTNLLMRVCDVLITKPSELSYYPVPKLFIQRVGRHEAWGAIRGSEIGDGTIEADSPGSLRRILHCLITEQDLIKLYCRHIIANKAAGLYDGAVNTVKLSKNAF